MKPEAKFKRNARNFDKIKCWLKCMNFLLWQTTKNIYYQFRLWKFSANIFKNRNTKWETEKFFSSKIFFFHNQRKIEEKKNLYLFFLPDSLFLQKGLFVRIVSVSFNNFLCLTYSFSSCSLFATIVSFSSLPMRIVALNKD